MIRLLPVLLVSLIAAIAGSGAAAAQQGKVRALLMGIETYDLLPKEQHLKLAPNDAREVAAALKRLDPSAVTTVPTVRLTLAAIRQAWEQHLRSLDDRDTSLFWFSGHGTEIEGRSYLLPANIDPARLGSVAALNSTAIGLQKMLADFQERVRGRNIVGVFVIDACRDTLMVPAGAAARQGPGTAASQAQPAVTPLRPGDERGGLVLSHPPPDTIVLFSAASRQVALERLHGQDPAQTSVYTRNLLSILIEPEKHGIDVLATPVEHLAKLLRWNVFLTAREARPSRTQTPAYIDEMLKHRNLLGREVAPAALAAPSVRPARTAAAESADPGAQGGSVVRSLGLGTIIKDCNVCPELVEIPTGTFHIGSGPEPGKDRPAEASEHPRTEISISHRVALGRFEISRGEWLSCQSDADRGVACTELVKPGELGRSLRKPITDVTWHDAQRYVTWLNRLLERNEHKQLARYRLPSEAEWEYAARAGSAAAYAFGDDPADLCQHANGADVSLKSLLWSNPVCRDGHGREAAQIDSYTPNGFGLHNMHGNVWEWTADCWAPTHDGIDASGKARAGTGCNTRTVRGGSWRSAPWSLRSARRIGYAETHARGTLGFRVALDLDGGR